MLARSATPLPLCGQAQDLTLTGRGYAHTPFAYDKLQLAQDRLIGYNLIPNFTIRSSIIPSGMKRRSVFVMVLSML